MESERASTRRPLNILMVDDDDIDVMNVRRAFVKANITNPLFVASNGLDALQQLRSGKIPTSRLLALVDVNMPRMGGLEFLREVRNDPQLRQLTAVMLTTSNEEKDRTSAFDLNVAGYLVKPVRFFDFLNLMATLNMYWELSELP